MQEKCYEGIDPVNSDSCDKIGAFDGISSLYTIVSKSVSNIAKAYKVRSEEEIQSYVVVFLCYFFDEVVRVNSNFDKEYDAALKLIRDQLLNPINLKKELTSKIESAALGKPVHNNFNLVINNTKVWLKQQETYFPKRNYDTSTKNRKEG